MKYTDEQIKDAVLCSKSYQEVLRRIGASKHSSQVIKKRVVALGLDVSHFRGGRQTFTEEKLREVVGDCKSYADVARKFRLEPIGGNLVCIREACKKFEIDVEHFVGQAHNKNKPSRQKKKPEEILILRLKENPRYPGRILTRALLEIGREYKCEVDGCNVKDIWNKKSITLRIDHIDGQYWDCRKENLRFICPNCDSQSETYCARNIKR